MTIPAFPIFAFQQPVSSFSKWRSRGINTLVNCVSGPDQDVPTDAAYIAAAKAAGFYTIADHPDSDCWAHVDEADGKGVSPAACLAKYRVWKAAAPNKPVYLNLDGRRRQYTPFSVYQAYAQSCDWLGADRYQVEWGLPLDVALIGGDVDILRAAAPTKKIFYIVGCGQQNLELSPALQGMPQAQFCRPPTLDELKQQVATAVSHGVNGLGYFSHNPYGANGGWSSFDSTTPDIALALPALNAALTPPVISPATRPAGPLDGKTMSLDGYDYTINAKR